jgi:hypothetical protein
VKILGDHRIEDCDRPDLSLPFAYAITFSASAASACDRFGFGMRLRFCRGMNAIGFWVWLGGRSRLLWVAIASWESLAGGSSGDRCGL